MYFPATTRFPMPYRSQMRFCLHAFHAAFIVAALHSFEPRFA